MAAYLIDASAWVEYFLGTRKGQVAMRIVENEHCITAESTVSEIVSWGLRAKQDVPALLDAIRRYSELREIYLNVWVEAAQAKHEHRSARPKVGIMDGILIALQNATGATIVTADADFRGLKNVVII